jgi:hypothetical protein
MGVQGGGTADNGKRRSGGTGRGTTEVLKCILGCGSKGRCFLGGVFCWTKKGKLNRGAGWTEEVQCGRAVCRVPEALQVCGDWSWGAGVSSGWLAGPRKQHLNPPDPAAC